MLLLQSQKQREFSSAGLEHLPYKQRVTGSNPVTPTKRRIKMKGSSFFICDLLISESTLNIQLYTLNIFRYGDTVKILSIA